MRFTVVWSTAGINNCMATLLPPSVQTNGTEAPPSYELGTHSIGADLSETVTGDVVASLRCKIGSGIRLLRLSLGCRIGFGSHMALVNRPIHDRLVADSAIRCLS